MDLLVNRKDLHETRAVAPSPTALDEGQARLRIDCFALTANNITYAVMGDALQYWGYFPADDPWGRVPVWGFAEVVESRHDGVAVGTRLFGFLPMSEELVITVGKLEAGGVTDAAAHRPQQAAVYNRYSFAHSSSAEAGPGPDPVDDDRRMVLYPLFVTSFLADDFLGDNGYFGAERVVISSASSKTALGVAHRAAGREGLEVVGLTSPGNVDFVTGLGIHDVVASHDAVDQLPTGPTVYVDLAGSAAVRNALHAHYGDDLRHDMIIGGTHWEDIGRSEGLAGAKPEFFFAPAQIAKRSEEWGPDGLDRRIGEAWDGYADWTADWIDFRHGSGADAVAGAYLDLLENRADPRVGHILSMG